MSSTYHLAGYPKLGRQILGWLESERNNPEHGDWAHHPEAIAKAIGRSPGAVARMLRNAGDVVEAQHMGGNRIGYRLDPEASLL